MTVPAATPAVVYTAVCEREGDWWVITVPELQAGQVTQARFLDEVPATVADLVSTMTGARPGSVEVNVRAHAGPGISGLTKAGLLAAAAALAFALARRLSRSVSQLGAR